MEVIATWWAENRPAAPGLFHQELVHAFELLSRSPRLGEEWPSLKLPNVRRWLLRECRYHVYYTVDEARSVVVMRVVWAAMRGSTPRL